MASNFVISAFRELEKVAKEHPQIAIAFSGGKDSLVVLDMCCKVFESVVGFYMYLVPGLRCVEEQLEYARQRWGLTVLQVPHWVAYRCIKYGTYCNEHYSKDAIPDVELWDIYQGVLQDTGLKRIAHGAKSADSSWRRRFFHATRTWDFMVYPVKEFLKMDIIAYLNANKIPVPKPMGTGANVSGIDLSRHTILWLHDNFPDDYEKICRWFPYAPAVVKRRDFYGAGK